MQLRHQTVWSSRALRAMRAALIVLSLAGCAASHNGMAPAQPTATNPSATLASWRDTPTKRAIESFVADVTREGSPSFVPPAQRIAVFDNDGTLWSEQPLYFQFVFMLDQVKAVAPQHPEWKNNPAFKALIAKDYGALANQQKALLQLVAVANSGMTVDEYDRTIGAWLASARHPKFGRPYTDLVYQPQLELLDYLRANGFKTFIVSGGTIEFMRAWAAKAYGIPPEQVIGSSQVVRYEVRNGQPVLVREPKLEFVDDGAGKPVGIYRSIGHKPILAFGNSDGDLQMLQYTAAGPGPHLALLLHHDDAAREFAYDRASKVGKLDKAWDEAVTDGWTVVSMKNDWQTVFPAPQQ
ncbi:haloacid dehalogenase-like hydrolase family protein [Paraburkholderia xenovorans LB400]|uniref:phosphoserine phosphatase n=1 Tax=Paraburkholderia xenovorans (strain LB400) TaxID=266265 RepID=Q13YK4_PARXL|nr:HAD family hydrolase [Paraburkholderia xenovorans]ABE30835.1 Putative nonspecific acid phosphatase, NapD-like protein [Paraburkholderia xenovorans LB400]AIP29521.1 haloacid dehalogenase-like hydrolase family protein [Paraburkholderia xenovorans LB400]